MKKIMKKIALLSVVASLTAPAFAGLVEHELEAGSSSVTELVFVAKTSKTVILRLAQPGVADDLRDGTLDGSPDETYGFAFGQPNGGVEPNAWENYVINTVGPVGTGLQDEICGDPTINNADSNQMIKATTSDIFLPEVYTGGSGIDLAGSCTVTETSAESTVATSVKLAYEVLVSGGASIDLDLAYDNGIEADLVTPNASMSFSTFNVGEAHYDAAGASVSKDIQANSVSMGHGDHGVLTFNIGFEATGANAVPERRASAILTATVPL